MLLVSGAVLGRRFDISSITGVADTVLKIICLLFFDASSAGIPGYKRIIISVSFLLFPCLKEINYITCLASVLQCSQHFQLIVDKINKNFQRFSS